MPPQDNFERAATDVFSFTAPNCGTMKRIVIGHDNSNPGSAWHLNKVRVSLAAPHRVTCDTAVCTARSLQGIALMQCP